MKQKQREAAHLKTVIEQMHGGTAHYLKQVSITEKFEGQTVWKGVIYVFSLIDHEQTDTCYAWSAAVEGSNKRRFYAVLKIPPVESPEAAVRAAIVADYKAGRPA